MGRTRSNSKALVFILFTPKWIKIKDPEKIENWIKGVLSFTSINTSIFNGNCLKTKFFK